MIQITVSNLIFGSIGLFGTIFAIYHYFKNPQIRTDRITDGLSSELLDLRKQILEIKETHLRTVENDIKNLTAEISKLSLTVVRLSTIIDERIPKGSPNLTPPGV